MTSSTNPANRIPHPQDDGESVIHVDPSAVPPSMANSRHPSENELFPVKINGQEVMLTREQVTARLQKDMAGDEKLRQAAELTKDANQAIALRDDLRAFREDGDEDAMRRAGAIMGVPGDEVERILRDARVSDGLDDDDEDVVAAFHTKNPPQRPAKISYDDMTPDLQRIMKLSEKARIKEFVDAALDSDEVVSYNMNRLDEKGQSTIRKLVDEKIRGRLDGVGGDFGDGSQILPDVVRQLRELFTDALGSPERSHGSMSLGSAPGGHGGEIYPQKLPDHVPSSDGDAFEQNVMETMMYHHKNAERGKQ